VYNNSIFAYVCDIMALTMTEQQPKKVLLKDVMTKKVISVLPETSIIEATRIITEHNFDGMPVIDSDGRLAGIITEYDLITKTSTLNVSFLQKIITDVHSVKKESPPKIETKDISDLTVADIMNREPLTLKEDTTFEDAIETFKTHHRVNPIPIVNSQNQVVGIISRFDILRPLNILGYSKKH